MIDFDKNRAELIKAVQTTQATGMVESEFGEVMDYRLSTPEEIIDSIADILAKQEVQLVAQTMETASKNLGRISESVDRNISQSASGYKEGIDYTVQWLSDLATDLKAKAYVTP